MTLSKSEYERLKKDPPLCACGCGRRVFVSKYSYASFIYGHQARGRNNSRYGVKLDLCTKKKISYARRRQGNPWWVGRKHAESSKRKMSAWRSKAFKGSGNPFFGRKHKRSSLRKMREATLRQLSSKPSLPTRPERVLHDELQRRGIQFRVEQKITGLCVDVVIPSLKLIIYVDGCYWHACPQHRPDGYKPKNDKIRVRKLRSAGYSVEILWEHDLQKRVSSTIDRLLRPYLGGLTHM